MTDLITYNQWTQMSPQWIPFLLQKTAPNYINLTITRTSLLTQNYVYRQTGTDVTHTFCLSSHTFYPQDTHSIFLSPLQLSINCAAPSQYSLHSEPVSSTDFNQPCTEPYTMLWITWVWAITRITLQYFTSFLKFFSIDLRPSSSCHFFEVFVKAFFLDLYLQFNNIWKQEGKGRWIWEQMRAISSVSGDETPQIHPKHCSYWHGPMTLIWWAESWRTFNEYRLHVIHDITVYLH